MNRIFNQNGISVTINTDARYSGASDVDENDRLVRKVLGLPVTKELVYYSYKQSVPSAVPVSSFQVSCILDGWFILDITLSDGEVHSIHSSYLSEMQRPSFISDMKKQEAAL